MLGAVSCGRGVLSMSALSYGVIRVDQENSLTSLTLQDCGQIMPGGMCDGVYHIFLYLSGLLNAKSHSYIFLQLFKFL